MANFNLAFKYTVGIEKGYVVDNGGPTYKGISWKAWGKDPLVKKIFAILRTYPLRKNYIVKNNPQLDAMIVQFFKTNYWDKIKGDAINNQTLANFIYDFYVNSNSAVAIITRTVTGTAKNRIDTDTLDKLNAYPEYYYAYLKMARQDHYDNLVAADKTLKKYYNGWMNRLALFPDQLATAAATAAPVVGLLLGFFL